MAEKTRLVYTKNMLFDALDASTLLDRSTDIAIVGSGPSAITLATALAHENREVLLLEAGGLVATDSNTDSLAGVVTGLPYPMTETRARQFGGSTALWAGYCALFDALDFEKRAWVENSGWPIDSNELTRHYSDAARLLNVGDASFDPNQFDRPAVDVNVRLPEEQFMHTIWRFGEQKADFAAQYRTRLEDDPSTHVLLNASATDIRLLDNGRAVESIEVKTATGRKGRISARTFVLAAGGIETPRLMLASNHQRNTGVGNDQGYVGRCFMEHPHIEVDGIALNPELKLDEWTGVTESSGGRKYTRCFGLQPQIQESLGVVNSRAHFFRTPSMPANAVPRVGLFFEQTPNLQSRVMLADVKDSVGLPRARLHWSLCEADKESHRIVTRLIADAFVERGLAARTGSETVGEEILHSNHQLGTTRMSEDPRAGVVDSDCKVHGIDNLYICGGSVFPTVSWANPTVTVLALALRLAETLRSEQAS